jgi:HicA toxin of bacterial toxin-antitoxin,
VNAKHRKTLEAIFSKPTLANIHFAAIEALVIALGGQIVEREGSRIQVLLSGEQWRVHRPHPGKEAKRYQVDEVRELLTRTGNQP